MSLGISKVRFRMRLAQARREDSWLTAADRDHNFQPVAGCQRHSVELATRHNLAVAFDGNTFTSQFQIDDQLGHIEWLRKLFGRAVNGEFDQLQIPLQFKYDAFAILP